MFICFFLQQKKHVFFTKKKTWFSLIVLSHYAERTINNFSVCMNNCRSQKCNKEDNVSRHNKQVKDDTYPPKTIKKSRKILGLIFLRAYMEYKICCLVSVKNSNSGSMHSFTYLPHFLAPLCMCANVIWLSNIKFLQ